MTRSLALLVTALVGILFGTLVAPSPTHATPIHFLLTDSAVFDVSGVHACPAGTYRAMADAVDPNGNHYAAVLDPLTISPTSGPVTFTWPTGLPPTTYTVTVRTTELTTGQVWASEPITGFVGTSTAPVPQPTTPPSPTPTTTPPAPTPPSSNAWVISSPASGATISGIVPVSAPNPQPGSTAGFKVELRTVAGLLVRQSNTYNASAADTTLGPVSLDTTTVTPGGYVLRGLFSLSVSADLPVMVASLGTPPVPTPTSTPPAPTPTSTPTPVPIDFSPVVNAINTSGAATQAAVAASATTIGQQLTFLLSKVDALATPPTPPAPVLVQCTLNGVTTNVDGTQRVTSMKCPAGTGLAVGQILELRIKK